MNKTFIIAEMSANHGHSLDMALKTVSAAKEAGEDTDIYGRYDYIKL